MPNRKPSRPRRAPGTSRRAPRRPAPAAPRTLVLDIGGTGVKGTVFDAAGKALTERVRVETPVGEPPATLVAAAVAMTKPFPAFDRVSAGFPGVVKNGVTLTAPNLRHDGWAGFDLAGALSAAFGRPARVVNDADLLGLGLVQGRGLEMVVTLGTGFGTSLFLDGRLLPHLEISHMTFRQGEDFDAQVGNGTRKEIGSKRWNRRVAKAIDLMRALVHFDRLWISGGNAKHLDFELPPDVSVAENGTGMAGGVRLWES